MWFLTLVLWGESVQIRLFPHVPLNSVLILQLCWRGFQSLTAPRVNAEPVIRETFKVFERADNASV